MKATFRQSLQRKVENQFFFHANTPDNEDFLEDEEDKDEQDEGDTKTKPKDGKHNFEDIAYDEERRKTLVTMKMEMQTSV